MGRRKKEKIQEGVVEELPRKRLSEDTKRSIVALVSVFFAILFILGFFGIAGFVGVYLDLFAKLVFGWGKWLFPVLLFLMGGVLLRKTIRFYLMSILGLSVIFVAFLGFLHIFFEESTYHEMIALGRGGGYVGYGLAVGSIFLFGKIGAVVTLSVFVLIGSLVAFNSSLFPFFEKIFQVTKFVKRNKNDESKSRGFPVAETKQEGYEKEKSVSSEGQQIENNISNEIVSGGSPEDIQEMGNSNIGSIRFQGSDLLMPENKGDFVELAVEGDKKIFDTKEYGKKENLLAETMLGGSSDGRTWILPSVEMMKFRGKGCDNSGDADHNKMVIQETLRQFGISVEDGGEKFGPTVTQYMFRPAAGVKLERITALSNNLAMALSAQSIRIEAPIPGKSLVGIEVPNRDRGTVSIREILESEEYRTRNTRLLVPLGKNVSGEVEVGDLEKMPHLLIAGTTGSGKSVCINAILTMLLYQNTPEQLQLILVDPKRVELSLYNGIPHLKSPVIVENKKVLGALKWAVGEMERRYKILQENQSRNIAGYNERVIQRRKREMEDLPFMPYIVIVIDELADLMGSHGKEVEGAIARIAQMARAVGIHLIIATQRPDVHVLTGLIKTNISTRIAFRVPTQIDSRTILDKGGAEKLLGLGDMLFIDSTNPAPTRIQGVFLSSKEVKRIVHFWKAQNKENQLYQEEGKEREAEAEANRTVLDFGDISEKVGSFQDKLDIESFSQEESVHDSMFPEAKELVERVGKASTSLIQRHLRIGYNRAARIIDELESSGIVGPADGAKPREVYKSINSNQQPTMHDTNV